MRTPALVLGAALILAGYGAAESLGSERVLHYLHRAGAPLPSFPSDVRVEVVSYPTFDEQATLQRTRPSVAPWIGAALSLATFFYLGRDLMRRGMRARNVTLTGVLVGLVAGAVAGSVDAWLDLPYLTQDYRLSHFTIGSVEYQIRLWIAVRTIHGVLVGAGVAALGAISARPLPVAATLSGVHQALR